MPDYEHILYEKQRGGVLITLNRPEALNAITPPLEAELHAALDEGDADPEVRAIVLTGAGRAFSSGYDMARPGGPMSNFSWPYGTNGEESAAAAIDRWHVQDTAGFNKIAHLWDLATPVISAINGWAMGGGSWYALTSHMTYASEQAVFAQPEVRHISNTNFMWTVLAGYKNALRYGLTGDHVDANEAMRIGLVNKVVPHDQLLEECFTLVERIAKVSPETVKANLFVSTQGLNAMGLRNAWMLNAKLSALAHSSSRADFRKGMFDSLTTGGMRSFLQERDGPFQPEPFGPRSRPRS